jgi:ribosomal protein S18 acetylase RimI-like enzyme
MNPVIRDYRKGDFEGLQKLWNDTGMGDEEREDTEEAVERCNQMGGRLLVMENPDTGEVIGSSWMTWDGRRMYLHHFGVLPEMQNRGFGTMLAEESLKWILGQGRQVKLEVHKQNHPARHLYEKMGFFRFTDYEILMRRS